jgi:hypothetical protein
MATHIGSEGVVRIGANAVGEVTAFSLSIDSELIPQKKLGDTFESYKAGTRSWKGEVTCHWDEGDTNGQAAIEDAILGGTSVTLNLYPEGATTGDYYYTGTAFLSSMSVDISDNDSTVTAKYSFTGSGSVAGATA